MKAARSCARITFAEARYRIALTSERIDLTPEAACRNLYSKFFRNDGKIEFLSIENARHGFDNPFLYFGFTFDKLPNLMVMNLDHV